MNIQIRKSMTQNDPEKAKAYISLAVLMQTYCLKTLGFSTKAQPKLNHK